MYLSRANRQKRHYWLQSNTGIIPNLEMSPSYPQLSSV